MINTPPPTVPGTVPAASLPLPSIAVPADVQAVSDQLVATLAALKQQTVLAVTKAELDATKQLLTLLTPQGAVTVKLPSAVVAQPLPALTVALPNGQSVPLGDLLAQVASLPPAALKNVYVQLDKPTLPGQLPTLKLLLNPQEVLTSTKQAVSATAPSPVTQTAATTAPSIRTTLTPIPESAVRALGFLTPDTAKSDSAVAVSAPSILDTAITTVKAKINGLISRTTTPIGASTPAPPAATPATHAEPVKTPVNTALNPRLPVDVVSADAPDAVSATVLGATPKGEAIVRTSAGQVFSLANVRAANPGSIVYLRSVVPAPADLTPTAHEPETLDKLLNDMVRIIQTIDPALAARVSQQFQAAPGANMGGALLMIFSVLTGGVLTGKPTQRSIALSDEIEKALPEGTKSRLIAMLNDDPINLTRFVPDQIGVEWRGHQLPTPQLPGFSGPVWFYVQQQRQDQYSGGGSNQSVDSNRQTRFVIDMDFTRLGHTQLEGITGPQRIDLKINTGSGLPDAMQKELRDTYVNAISAYGLTGALTFSNDAPVDLDGPHSAMQVIS